MAAAASSSWCPNGINERCGNRGGKHTNVDCRRRCRLLLLPEEETFLPLLLKGVVVVVMTTMKMKMMTMAPRRRVTAVCFCCCCYSCTKSSSSSGGSRGMCSGGCGLKFIINIDVPVGGGGSALGGISWGLPFVWHCGGA